MFQVIFPGDKNEPKIIHNRFHKDALAFNKLGISVGSIPRPDATRLMYRGFTIYREEDYPQDSRYIQTYVEYRPYLYISLYYPYISDLSIETFFVEDLDERLQAEILSKGWKRAFIKKETHALEHYDEGKSIWPNTSFEEMLELYEPMQIEGKYAIRKFIEKEIIDQEERYWVFNGNIYHRENKIPEVVQEAARRLNKLGSHYYTIDATPEFVVEVNPGESSDRHAVNSAELFASWIKKEFVK
jgi:hypothetical protein